MQVVIPLGIGSNWNNNELKYCLRSIEKHLKFDIEVIILGEQGVSIPWLQNCLYVELNRFYPDNLVGEYGSKKFEQFFCTLAKYKWISQQDFIQDDFILMYDDQLILNTIDDYRVFENVALCADRSNKNSKSRHSETISQALDLSRNEKHHDLMYNGETHAPRLYNKQLLQKLFHRYPFEKMKIPYSLYTLYRNIFYGDPKTIIKDEACRLMAYCHFEDGTPHHKFPVTIFEIEQDLKDYLVCNYTDKGLNVCGGVFKVWVENKYNVKSCFEI